MKKQTDMRLEECKNFSEVLSFQSAINPDRIYVYDVRSEREYTFKQFDIIVTNTAVYFQSLGVKPGDRITALIENSPEYCFCYFASIRVGAIFNPMPFSSHKEEVKKNIRYTEPEIILVDSRRFGEFSGESGRFIDVPVHAERDFEKSIKNMGNAQEGRTEINEDTPACLYYSSGTTGDPKGVMFSHRNMISNISSICRGFQFDEERECHLVMLPLGHTASTNYSLLPCMYIGGRMVMAESFWHIRGSIWKLIREHRVTYMEVVPTVLYSMLNIYKEVEQKDVSTVRFVGCGSAPLQKGIQEEFMKRFTLKVANLYGLSETGPTHIDNPLEPNWKPGTIGRPLDVNEIKIFGNERNELGTGDVGEIAVKGDNVFVGYFKNEALYREVMKDGYFFTGDLGYVDKEGIHYFVERKKDLIIKGGTNITPGEIDEVLLLHPAVKEAATVGIPDPMFGEDIKSFITIKDNMELETREALDHCRKHLHSLKVPKDIEIVDKLPTTHSGKLLRKALRERERKAAHDRK
ncbi:class I adenylate-forming enzyme family protein [Fibrobacterota bacterium]